MDRTLESLAISTEPGKGESQSAKCYRENKCPIFSFLVFKYSSA